MWIFQFCPNDSRDLMRNHLSVYCCKTMVSRKNELELKLSTSGVSLDGGGGGGVCSGLKCGFCMPFFRVNLVGGVPS